ncbi:cytochrome P450 71A1-like [Rutidosis leptorrhynchoides]|uniref:cytochrome P450 71A1-like n=1 Tax=Rutidosis leptorrhynchoides TaxID=125765 RepID=UPI003A99181A
MIRTGFLSEELLGCEGRISSLMALSIMSMLQQAIHSSSNNLFAFIVIFFSYIYILYSRKKNNNHININVPPSPPRLPIIGNLHQIGKQQIHRNLKALSDKYGPIITVHAGSSPILVVSSMEAVDEIIKDDVIFSDRTKTRGVRLLCSRSDDMIFSDHNAYWKFSKKVFVNQLLSSSKVRGLRFVREQETRKVMEKLKLASLDNVPVNLGDIFVAITSSVVSGSAFGRAMNQNHETAGKLVREVVQYTFQFWMEDLFPSLAWIDVLIGNTSRFNNICNELHDFFDRVIEDHQAFNGEKSEEKGFVDIFLDVLQDKTADIQITKENIKTLLLDMFIAAIDTSAAALEWAMAELVKNPRIMKKAQEEVRAVVGKKSAIDEDDLNEMMYLKLIIKETVRLYAPLVPRETSKDTVLMGYNIPAKTQVLVNTWAIRRDPLVWDKPNEFCPERFEDDADSNRQRYFIPFGFGRRGCPGIMYANAVLEHVLANLLCWFDWKLPHGMSLEDLDMGDCYDLIIHKKIPLSLVPVACSCTCLIKLNFNKQRIAYPGGSHSKYRGVDPSWIRGGLTIEGHGINTPSSLLLDKNIAIFNAMRTDGKLEEKIKTFQPNFGKSNRLVHVSNVSELFRPFKHKVYFLVPAFTHF